MPKKTSPRYGIAYGWTLGEGPWNTDMDANLKLLDIILGGSAINDSLTTPPGGVNSTWDSAHKSSTVVLSNGNLTAAMPGGSQTAAIGTTPLTGKVYFEVTIVSGSLSSNAGVGVAPQTASLTSQVGYSYNDSAGLQLGGTKVYYNQGSAGALFSAISVGQVIGVAYDATARKVWFRVGSGGWDNGGTDNPATGTGGYTINGTETLYPIVNSDLALTVTANFGATAFANAAPSGFGSLYASGAAQPGDCYIVAAGATGSWAGKDGQVAAYIDNTWMFVVPKRGLIMDVQSASALKKYDGSAWALVTTGGGGSSTPIDGSGELDGFVDGNFDSWNINTTFSVGASDMYTADMWLANAGTSGAATVSQDTPAVGVSPSWIARPREFRLKYQQTTAATASPTVGQKLEGVRQYDGQSITVQATLAAAAADTLVVGVKATQNFGTGGSPSASVVTTQAVTWAIGTSEQKFSVRLDIPSIGGKTLGTNGNDYLRIDLLLATGKTFTLYHSQLQIDVCLNTASTDTNGAGGTPLPYRYRGASVENARVWRFLELVLLASGAFSGTGGAGAGAIAGICYATGVTTFVGGRLTYRAAKCAVPSIIKTSTTCRVVAGAGVGVQSGVPFYIGGVDQYGFNPGATIAASTGSAAGWIDSYGNVYADARL